MKISMVSYEKSIIDSIPDPIKTLLLDLSVKYKVTMDVGPQVDPPLWFSTNCEDDDAQP